MIKDHFPAPVLNLASWCRSWLRLEFPRQKPTFATRSAGVDPLGFSSSMANRNGRYFASLGGLILLLAVAGSGECQPRPEALDRRAETRHRAPQPPVPSRVERATEGAPCTGARPGENADRCYGRRAAEAAEKQALQAAIANRLSLLQAIGLGATVLLTMFGLSLAHRALTRVERAFVFVEDYKLEKVGDYLVVRPAWKNSGSTPAMKMIIRAAWKHFPKPLEAYDFPDIDEHGNVAAKFSDVRSMFLGPNNTAYGNGIRIPVHYIRMLAAGECAIYLWGWAEYDDVLGGRRHRTEFCRELIVTHTEPANDPEQPGALRMNYSLRGHWQHNGADSQCMKKTDRWPGNPTTPDI